MPVKKALTRKAWITEVRAEFKSCCSHLYPDVKAGETTLQELMESYLLFIIRRYRAEYKVRNVMSSLLCAHVRILNVCSEEIWKSVQQFGTSGIPGPGGDISLDIVTDIVGNMKLSMAGPDGEPLAYVVGISHTLPRWDVKTLYYDEPEDAAQIAAPLAGHSISAGHLHYIQAAFSGMSGAFYGEKAVLPRVPVRFAISVDPAASIKGNISTSMPPSLYIPFNPSFPSALRAPFSTPPSSGGIPLPSTSELECATSPDPGLQLPTSPLTPWAVLDSPVRLPHSPPAADGSSALSTPGEELSILHRY